MGVVLGPSVQYDAAKDEIVIDTSKYMDKGAYTGTEGIANVNEVKEKIVLNSDNAKSLGLWYCCQLRSSRNWRIFSRSCSSSFICLSFDMIIIYFLLPHRSHKYRAL